TYFQSYKICSKICINTNEKIINTKERNDNVKNANSFNNLSLCHQFNQMDKVEQQFIELCNQKLHFHIIDILTSQKDSGEIIQTHVETRLQQDSSSLFQVWNLQRDNLK